MLKASNSRTTLLGITVSALSLILIWSAIDWEEATKVYRGEISATSLVLFFITAWTIPLIYGFRWRLLLDGRIGSRDAIISSIVSMGGNMVLPARGGDLLRLHHSLSVGQLAAAELVGRLGLEKVIDLVASALIGLAAIIFLDGAAVNQLLPIFISLTGIALVLIFGLFVILKYQCATVIRCLKPIFKKVRRVDIFNRYVARLLVDTSRNLTAHSLAVPAVITLLMWLSTYALSYILAARVVGVVISYPESLLLIFAGALGLMLPAAPSGAGTFHASIVSAFTLIGRSPVEGLLLGTVIHGLFVVAMVIPASFVYLRWRIRPRPGR